MNSLSRVVLAAAAVSVAAMWSLQALADPGAVSLENVVTVVCPINTMAGKGTLSDPYTCSCQNVDQVVVGGGAVCVRDTDHLAVSIPCPGGVENDCKRSGASPSPDQWAAACFDAAGQTYPVAGMRVFCLAP